MFTSNIVMKKIVLPLAAIFIFITASFTTQAQVRLPSIIGSHMVLQQNSRVKLWGWCNTGEKIKVSTDWDTTTYNTIGSGDAKWSIDMKTPAAGGPHKITISGSNTIVLDDVVMGEVWLCSGQSNMEMNVNWGLKQYDADVAQATNTSIRLFQIPRTTAEYPQEDVQGKWVVCNPEDMKSFSLAGYFFGKKLQQDLKVPVGLINASWGGTPAEVWTPKPVIENDPVLKKAASLLKPAPGWPITPGLTYNGMIYALTNYNIAGTIWYQGEANTSTASTYESLFTTMIGSWRKSWQKDFPFYYVEIAPFAGYGNTNISSALLREAQTKSLSYPNTGMVVVSDLVNDINDIHPLNKRDVGLRLANYALAQTYGKKDVVYKSPEYKSMKVEKGKVRIYFENADNGLMSKNGAPIDFYIAGADKKFVPATAKIDGNTVIVWNKTIKDPVAVRFGFNNSDMPNLFSKEGLPVNIFRTDDWQEETAAK